MIDMVKERARAAFKLQYWPIVGNELLASILVGGFGGLSLRFSKNDLNNLRELVGNDAVFSQVIRVLLGVVLTVGVIGILYSFLVGNVIRVGLAKLRLSAYRQENFRTEDLFSAFKQYGRCVGTMALYTLFVTLGTILFIIPGIIVAYGLYEVPFLLAEDPSLSGMDAIRRSWNDMKGHKGELFGLELSFIGWILLSILTCGILAVFYTGPYMALAGTGFYHELHHNVTSENFSADSFHE